MPGGTLAVKHPKNSRIVMAGSNLLITDMSLDDNVPTTDATNTESLGRFEAGDEGGIEQVTFEFTAIVPAGAAPDVTPGNSYAATMHHGDRVANSGYDGTVYIESIRLQGQPSQNGPQVYTGRGTFSGEFTRPTV